MTGTPPRVVVLDEPATPQRRRTLIRRPTTADACQQCGENFKATDDVWFVGPPSDVSDAWWQLPEGSYHSGCLQLARDKQRHRRKEP